MHFWSHMWLQWLWFPISCSYKWGNQFLRKRYIRTHSRSESRLAPAEPRSWIRSLVCQFYALSIVLPEFISLPSKSYSVSENCFSPSPTPFLKWWLNLFVKCTFYLFSFLPWGQEDFHLGILTTYIQLLYT